MGYVICYVDTVIWVKQCHLHHLPVITIFIGGIINSQLFGVLPGWLFYHVALIHLICAVAASDSPVR